ncbi:MAG: DUF4126 domain-containing protein [Phycisphaerae bacterium]|nr:DUF4126 domain-containing protein [Phycisphaerae bacterium]
MNVDAGEVVGYLFAGLVGFSLAAACGMRIFAPLAILSAAVHFGWISPGDKLAWIGSMPALVCFSLACVIEALGMMIPWVDHALDVAGAPVAAVAGTLVMATQLASAAGVDTSLVPAWVTWALAAVVGGGVATGVHAATGTVRAGSTAVSGGLLNPFFSLAETVSSFVLSALAVVLPIVAVIIAFVIVVALLVVAALVWQWRKRAAARADGRVESAAGAVGEPRGQPRGAARVG